MASIRAAQLSGEGAGHLQEGICLVLSRWSALHLAVENEWGGRDSCQKSQQLAVDILSWFTQSKEPLYIDDLEDMLDEFMLSLNTEIGDGSIEEIAEKLMVMYEECLEGNYKSIESLKENILPRVDVPHIRQAVSDDEDSDDENESLENDDSSDMAVDPPEYQSNLNEQKDVLVYELRRPKEVAEAEDGWTAVSSRRNRGRRN